MTQIEKKRKNSLRIKIFLLNLQRYTVFVMLRQSEIQQKA